MFKITPPFVYAAAMTAIVGNFALAVPLYAASNDVSDQNNVAPQTEISKTLGAMNVENRIRTLRNKLKITDAQEGDWTNVAQTMRDNEGYIRQLIQGRHKSPDSMTAIEDLQSYQKIAQAHADGLQKLTATFQVLYQEMSIEQQKNADVVFGHFEGHRVGVVSPKHRQ